MATASIVTLAVPLFQRYDTRSKLLTAADDPQFVRRIGWPPVHEVGGRGKGRSDAAAAAPDLRHDLRHHRQRRSNGPASRIPGATIEQHVVTVPDFGKIFFGELLITDLSRRLTMLRLELGSPIGGAVACAEVENNGSWST